MENRITDVLSEVAEYYSSKLSQYGETPGGVDWNGEAGQVLRFKQLTQVINSPEGFSINDLGCGYGALYDYLTSCYQDFNYRGYDISEEMIRTAQCRYANSANACFTVASAPLEMADYSIASGIFNVRLKCNDAEWQSYLEATLDSLNLSSRYGFAFNCLTSYSDADKMRDYLYYADPCVLFDLCKRKYSRQVALLHDYGLYEFTILVRKQ